MENKTGLQLRPQISPENIEVLTARVQSLHSSEPGRLEEGFKRSDSYEKKFHIARIVFDGQWHDDPTFFVENFIPPGTNPTPEALRLRQMLQLELIEKRGNEIVDHPKIAEIINGGTQELIQTDELLRELSDSLPIDVMGAITNVMLFANISEEKKRNEFRNHTTRSLLRPYLKDLKVKKSRGDINFADLVEKIPENVFGDIESVSFGIVKNYFARETLSWFVEGEDAGFKKLEHFIREVPDGARRVFFEKLWIDFQEAKDVQIPDVFKKELPGFDPGETVDFPAFRQKYFVHKFLSKRRDYLNGKTATGKTASSFLAMEAAGSKRVVIFGPARARNTWPSEARKLFTEGEDTPSVVTIDGLSGLDSEEAQNANYVFISGELLGQRAKPGTEGYEKVKKFLTETRNTDGVILDEAHVFQNPQAESTRALKGLVDEIEKKYDDVYGDTPLPERLPQLHLSATPISGGISDLDVSMSLLYPEFAFPGDEDEGKVRFSSQILKNPHVAYSLIMGEGLMTQWTLSEMYGKDVPELNYHVEKIDLTPEQRVLYEWINGQELMAIEKIRLLKDSLVNPKLLLKTARKNNLFPFDEIPSKSDLREQVIAYYREWQEWFVEKDEEIPDMKFGANWIAARDPNFILQCFFSSELRASVDELIRSANGNISLEDCEFTKTESPKFRFLRQTILEDLGKGKKIFIVSPHRREGITESIDDVGIFKDEEVDEEAILESLYTYLDLEWMSQYPKEARISIDSKRMKRLQDRAEAAKLWRESGRANLAVVATMETVYESMNWAITDADGNGNITGAAVYFLTWPWGWDDFEQMCGRFIRPGLTKPVEISILEAEDTLDGGLADTVKRKFLLQQMILSGLQLSDDEKELFGENQSSERILNYPKTGSQFVADAILKNRNSTEAELRKRFSKMYGDVDGYQLFSEGYLDGGKDEYKISAFNTELVKNILIEYGPEKILSVGAGTCLFARKIYNAEYPGIVDNLDINPAILQISKKQYPEAVHAIMEGGISDLSNVTLLSLNFSENSQMSIQDGSYDAVECSFMLPWTSLNRKSTNGDLLPVERIERVRALSEMNRVLKLGGKCAISLPTSVFDDDTFLHFTTALEKYFGFQMITDRSGLARATDLKKDIGWVITLAKVGNPDISGLDVESISFATDSEYSISKARKSQRARVVELSQEVLSFPKEFTVTNPITQEKYDGRDKKVKLEAAFHQNTREETLYQMKHSLEKGSPQWKLWNQLRKNLQRQFGIRYDQAEMLIHSKILTFGLGSPRDWSEESFEKIERIIGGSELTAA